MLKIFLAIYLVVGVLFTGYNVVVCSIINQCIYKIDPDKTDNPDHYRIMKRCCDDLNELNALGHLQEQLLMTILWPKVIYDIYLGKKEL